jgi:glycosyltransferase involved in cell wall biosynthesis
VIIVAPRAPDVSGGGTVVENYVPMFESTGTDVEVVSVRPGTRAGHFSPRVILPRESLHSGPLIRGRARTWTRAWRIPLVLFKRVDRARALRRYRRLLSGLGHDTLVVFTHVAPLVLLRESGHRWERRRPILVGQHHSPFASLLDDPRLGADIAREFAGMDAFTCLSAQDAEGFAAILPSTRCHVLPNPMRTRHDELAEALAPMVRRTATAVALARYAPEKQLDLMIRAFALATEPPELSHWRLELYGQGPEHRALETTIRETGAGARIALMGAVDDVFPVLSRASVNLLTSRYEGFGMSVLEAAQSGVPSIAFGCSPGLEQLLSTVHGQVVRPPNDTEAYAAALRTALADEDGLRRRGSLARAASAAYSPAAVARLWSAVVRSAYEAAGRRPDRRT